MSRRPKRRVIPWLVVILVLGLDQLSKQWALTALGKVGSTIVLPGPVDLTLVFNYSNAFGLVPVSGEFTRWGLTVLNLAIASTLAAVVLRSAARLNIVGFAFIAAGAIGNALDRIRFGAVVDLFDASKIGFIWIFNVADVSIDIGIALLLLATFLPRSGSGPLVPTSEVERHEGLRCALRRVTSHSDQLPPQTTASKLGP